METVKAEMFVVLAAHRFTAREQQYVPGPGASSILRTVKSE
jgi:hypothetical protein